MKQDSQKDLTKEDVERILGKPIHSFSTSPGANEGDNVAGSLLALEVFLKADEEPLHLVYKSFPTVGNEKQREYLTKFGIFRTETCMYEKIFPRIEELLQKRSKVQRKDITIPKYISGFNDDHNDYLCMDDLRHQGFVMQDKYHTLTEEEVTLVMKEIGRFHALTHFLIRYDGEKMFEEDERNYRIKYNARTVEIPMMTEFFAKMFMGHLENTVELLEPRNKELAEKVRQFREKNDHKSIYTIQKFYTHQTDKTMFPCIVHGDFWTNNVLFKYSKEGDRSTPIEAKFIDFQASRRGNIFEDLGYFFWTSTTPAFRKVHLDKMLQVYFTSFQETMEQLEHPMPQGFTRGSFIDGFYQGMLTSFLYMPFALGLQMGDLKYLVDPDEEKENEETNKGQNENSPSGSDKPLSSSPFMMDVDKMVRSDKKMHKLRMMHSPRAIDRLEDLTREAVLLKLI